MNNSDQTSEQSLHSQQHQKNVEPGAVTTGGGLYIGGNVTAGGDVIGRDNYTINISSGVVINIGTGQISFANNRPKSTEKLCAAIRKQLQKLNKLSMEMGNITNVKKAKDAQQLMRDLLEIFQDDCGLPQAMMTTGDAEVAFGMDNINEAVVSLHEGLTQNLLQTNVCGTGSYREIDIKLENVKSARGRRLRIKIPGGTILYPDKDGHRSVTNVK